MDQPQDHNRMMIALYQEAERKLFEQMLRTEEAMGVLGPATLKMVAMGKRIKDAGDGFRRFKPKDE